MSYSLSNALTILWDEFAEQFGAEALTGLLVIYGVILAVSLLIGLANYIMYGIAILRMAKRAGVKNGWLGFVPCANEWMLGRLSDVGSTRRHSGARILACSLVTLLGGGVSMILSFSILAAVTQNDLPSEAAMVGMAGAIMLISLLILAAAICLLVFYCMALYRIAQNFGGASASSFGIGLILTLFFCPIAMYIILLILSGKTPKYTEGGVSAGSIGEIHAQQTDTAPDSVLR